MKRRLLSACLYTDTFPGAFALLLGSEEEQGLGLQKAKVAWHAISQAEKKRHTNPIVQKLLEAMPFVLWVFVREALISMAQFSFRFVPPTILEQISTLFTGWGQSGVCENAVNRVRDHGRDSKNKKMQRMKRWMHPHTSCLIENVYKRSEVKAEAKWRRGHGRVSKYLFMPKASKGTVPEKLLQGIQGGMFWKSYTPQTFHIVPAAWSVLLHSSATGDWTFGAKVWMSEFLMEGFVVEQKELAKKFIVLASNKFGALLWPMKSIPMSAGVYVCPSQQTAGLEAGWKPVACLDNWQVWPATPEGPNQLRMGNPDCPDGVGGVLLRCAAHAEPVLVACARQGFAGLADDTLGRLIKSSGEEIVGARTAKTKLAKVEALVKHFLPGISESELIELLHQHWGKSKAISSVLDDAANVEHADGVFESTDKKEAMNLEKEQHAIGQAASQVKAYLHATGRATASSTLGERGSANLHLRLAEAGPGKKGRKRRQPEGAAPSASSSSRGSVVSTATCAEARKLLPQGVKGCLIQPYPQRHGYQVYYPALGTDRGSRYFTWSERPGGMSEERVLLACLRWAWAKHTAATSQPCPHASLGSGAQP